MTRILFVCHGKSFAFVPPLVLCGFPPNRKVHYNDCTAFEKCSDMTNIEMLSA